MNKYKCTECGANCTSNKAATKPNESLGTWHCPKHGKVPVKRVKE